MVSDMILTEDLLVSAGYDGRLLIYDLKAGEVRYVVPAGERIPRIELDKTGQNVIVATEFSKYALVIDLDSGKQLYRLEAEPSDEITDIGFSDDGAKAVAKEKSGRAIVGQLFRTPEELLNYAKEK
jgi:tricorn protease-like protein